MPPLLGHEIEWEEDPNIFIFHNEKPGMSKMHVFGLDLKDWVRIDSTYPAHMELRQKLLATKRDKVYISSDNKKTTECEQELLEMLCDYLPNRFPDIFERRPGGIYNRVTDETIPIVGDENAIVRAARLTQEDWCIMEKSKEGYVLTSGVVCFPMRWSLVEKFKMIMGNIHKPVDAFTKHLKTKAYSAMERLTPESPIWRANWAIFNDLDGPMDLYTPDGHLERKVGGTLTKYRGEATGRDLVFRAEYQTLRKLPKTECIAFSIRTYQRYLEDLPETDREGLIKAIEGLDGDMAKYKGAELWRDAAVKYLSRNKQKDRGLLPMVVLAVITACAAYYYR